MDESEFKTALRSLISARQDAVDPPTPDELVRARMGPSNDDDRERLAERAAWSPEIARALLDTHEFPEVEPIRDSQCLSPLLPPGGQCMSEAEVERQWQKFEERLHREEPSRSAVPEMFAWLTSCFNSLRFVQVTATALLVISVGLAGVYLRQQRSAATPRLNLPIVELKPEGERTRAETLRMPHEADGVLLVLSLRDQRPFSAYRATLEDADGEQVWSTAGLRRSADGLLTLELPRGFLHAGIYQLALAGIEADQHEGLATYRLTIE